MTLDMSFDQLSSNASYITAFKADYVKAVAASLGLPGSSVTVTDIRAGSVIVTSSILLPSETTLSDKEAIMAALKSGAILPPAFMQKFSVVAVVGALVTGPGQPAALVSGEGARSRSMTVIIAATAGAAGGTAVLASVIVFVLVQR
jgi:hypothetical protein